MTSGIAGEHEMTRDRNILALYMAHRGALVSYASRIVGDRARAEDVVQEAYLKVGALAEQRTLGEPLAYLYRTVRNLALDGARRLATERQYQHEDHVPWAVPLPPATPEQQTLHRDDLRRLAEALAELPERTRIAFDMHRLQGCTLREVAARLGVSTVRAHQLVKEAVLHAARKLDEEGD